MGKKAAAVKLALTFLLLILYSTIVLSQTIDNSASSKTPPSLTKSSDLLVSDDIVQERSAEESAIQPNSFALLPHKPNYIMPYYYTGSPYNSVYVNNTPEDESLKHYEFKYQFSFKVSVWKNTRFLPFKLFIAYTQMSYWQCYDRFAFFRETDYEPELFLSIPTNLHLYKNLQWDFISFGAVHQSNGFGNQLERSWNRLYVSAIISGGDWLFAVRPWFVFHDATYNRQNPNMAHYLGYSEIYMVYKMNNQDFSLQARNLIESGGKRCGLTAAWSFPLLPYIKGYVQAFSGYGQSLIEYNHRTNSVGVGIALNDWA